MSLPLKSSCHFPLLRPAAQKHEEADYDLELDLPIDFDDALLSEHATLGGRFVVALPRNLLDSWDAEVPNYGLTPEALVAAQAVAGRAEFSKSKRIVLLLGTARSIDFVSLLNNELNLWRHIACDSQEVLGHLELNTFLPEGDVLLVAGLTSEVHSDVSARYVVQDVTREIDLWKQELLNRFEAGTELPWFDFRQADQAGWWLSGPAAKWRPIAGWCSVICLVWLTLTAWLAQQSASSQIAQQESQLASIFNDLHPGERQPAGIRRALASELASLKLPAGDEASLPSPPNAAWVWSHLMRLLFDGSSFSIESMDLGTNRINALKGSVADYQDVLRLVEKLHGAGFEFSPPAISEEQSQGPYLVEFHDLEIAPLRISEGTRLEGKE